jgi:hypothetical protein
MSTPIARAAVPQLPPEQQHWWTAEEIAPYAGRSVKTVEYHHEQVKKRKLTIPYPEDFPLETAQAQRLLEFMFKKRRKPRKRKGKQE